ncbi:MAG: hypothetical protein Q8R27_07060 [Phenylobacterium sp.]|nr:hypothetical protein [Phenylobacterium sp.]
MFRVDQRFVGQGLWNTSALPMSLQAAMGLAKNRSQSQFADDVRIVPSEIRAIDLRV